MWNKIFTAVKIEEKLLKLSEENQDQRRGEMEKGKQRYPLLAFRVPQGKATQVRRFFQKDEEAGDLSTYGEIS